jgi:hypothetical protein
MPDALKVEELATILRREFRNGEEWPAIAQAALDFIDRESFVVEAFANDYLGPYVVKVPSPGSWVVRKEER